MPISATDLNKAYLAYFGRPADFSGQSYFANRDLSEVISAFDSSAESKTLYGNDVAAKVNAIYGNLFNRVAEPAGLTYWVGQIQAGKITAAGAALAILNGALGSDATAVQNKLAASAAFVAALDTTPEIVGYSGANAAQSAREWLKAVDATPASLTAAVAGVDTAVIAAVNTSSSGFGTGFNLDVTRDTITGTSGVDVFTARIFDNQNSLQSGDVINGGGDNDTLKADIGNSQKFAITPELNSVETVQIRVQADQGDSGDNNIAGFGIIDAERSVGVTRWESNNSRADLIIEDVRIAAGKITKDITIAMVDTDPGNVDFGVYFDQQSLRSGSDTTASRLSIQMRDGLQPASSAEPLGNLPVDGVNFLLAGKVVTLRSPAIDAAKTYAALASALNDAIAATPGAAGITASVGGPFAEINGITAPGNFIVLNDAQGRPFSDPGNTSFSFSTANNGPFTLLGNTNNAKAVTSDLPVTSTIVLDNVGRGSTGGDLIIGGLSVGDTSTSKGVVQFDVTVERSSKLQNLLSTNDTLQTVNLKNGAVNGDVTILGDVNPAGVPSNVALPGMGSQHDAYGLNDVKTLDASAMNGKVDVDAILSANVRTKYALNMQDVAADVKADNQTFSYSLGKNDDKLALDISASNLDKSGTTTREDFILRVAGNDGNDVITTRIVDGAALADTAGNWYGNSKQNANLAIDGGAGNDTINNLGGGDWMITAGAGDDVVYVDNGGVGKSAWVFNATAAGSNFGDLISTDLVAAQVLYKAKVTVTVSGADAGGSTGVVDPAASKFVVGFESVKTVPTVANTGTQANVNQAIKDAINNDSVLKNLLSANDGPSNTLVVTSKVDGQAAATDLKIDIEAARVTSLTDAEKVSLKSALKVVSDADLQTALDNAVNVIKGIAASGYNGTSVLEGGVTGAGSTFANDSTITLGTGNDLVVLSTGADSNNTLVYSGIDNGKDTIVNFSTTGSSLDSLDFTAYGVGKVAELSSITPEVTKVVGNNSVTVITGWFDAAKPAENFANLDFGRLIKAVNTDGDAGEDLYGLMDTTELSAATTAVGGEVNSANKQNHIVLVESNTNAGEYKAFHLVSNGVSAEFSTTEGGMIATMDFGASLAGLSLLNFGNASKNVVAGPVVVGPTLASAVAGAASVNEGASATFTLNTTGVVDGTTISYALTGVNAADVVGGLLTDTVVVTGNVATVSVALAADATTEGAETMTLTATLGTQTKAASVIVNDTSLTPVGPIPTPVTAAGAAGTPAADTFTVDVAAALADVAATNYQPKVTGFNVAMDKLIIDLPIANAAITTLAQLNGQQGVIVQADPFAGLTLVNLGNDANGGQVASVELIGITDPSLVQVQIV